MDSSALTHSQVIFFQWTTIFGIVLSPIIAVLVTLWHQGRKEKRQTRMSAFMNLFAYRHSFPLHQNFVTGLNTLDVVFSDHPEVVRLWKRYYDFLLQDSKTVNVQERLHAQTDLISEVAACVGYKKLKQTDIEKFYIPEVHFDQTMIDAEIRKELLSFLKSGSALHASLSQARMQSDENNKE